MVTQFLREWLRWAFQAKSLPEGVFKVVAFLASLAIPEILAKTNVVLAWSSGGAAVATLSGSWALRLALWSLYLAGCFGAACVSFRRHIIRLGKSLVADLQTPMFRLSVADYGYAPGPLPVRIVRAADAAGQPLGPHEFYPQELKLTSYHADATPALSKVALKIDVCKVVDISGRRAIELMWKSGPHHLPDSPVVWLEIAVGDEHMAWVGLAADPAERWGYRPLSGPPPFVGSRGRPGGLAGRLARLLAILDQQGRLANAVKAFFAALRKEPPRAKKRGDEASSPPPVSRESGG